MSTLTEDGISHVKQVACDRLLASRVEVKLKVGLRGSVGGGRRCPGLRFLLSARCAASAPSSCSPPHTAHACARSSCALRP